MKEPKKVLRLDVIHRIDGLENDLLASSYLKIVIHRIDGLEIKPLHYVPLH